MLLTNPQVVPPVGGPGTGPEFIRYASCVVEITSIAAPILNFGALAPFNDGTNTHCNDLVAASLNDDETLVFPFIARSYRLDPTKMALGVLQMSPSGELRANDWVDLAINVTTLQFATRYLEVGDVADVDGDGDPERDWYSSDAQNTPDLTLTRPANSLPIEVSITIETRAGPIVSGAGSSLSGNFTDTSAAPTSVNHNLIGDWGEVALPGAVPYDDNYVIRWATSTIDLRNMGVGQ